MDFMHIKMGTAVIMMLETRHKMRSCDVKKAKFHARQCKAPNRTPKKDATPVAANESSGRMFECNIETDELPLLPKPSLGGSLSLSNFPKNDFASRLWRLCKSSLDSRCWGSESIEDLSTLTV